MGFFKMLKKKVVPYLDDAAVITAQAAAGNPVGATLAVVETIQNRGREAHINPPAAAPNPVQQVADSVRAVAVSTDDHEARIQALEAKVVAFEKREAELEATARRFVSSEGRLTVFVEGAEPG